MTSLQVTTRPSSLPNPAPQGGFPRWRPDAAPVHTHQMQRYGKRIQPLGVSGPSEPHIRVDFLLPPGIA
jgi:hypothetical protein